MILVENGHAQCTIDFKITFIKKTLYLIEIQYILCLIGLTF